jgi:outer membrane protein OmpA-like peptidoglycan-associated protein
MHPITRSTLLGSAVLALGMACGGVTVFEGRSAVAGDAPAPVATPAPTPTMAAFVKAKHVMVTADHINIDEKIQFEQAKAGIKPESSGLLDEIATVMNANPQIKKIEIQGHASGEGDAKANTKLSDERAKAVMAALVSRKVKAETLTAKGYGSEKKIVEEKTDADREKNRRVEFLILDPAPKAALAALAAPTASAKPSATTTAAAKPSAATTASAAPKK